MDSCSHRSTCSMRRLVCGFVLYWLSICWNRSLSLSCSIWSNYLLNSCRCSVKCFEQKFCEHPAQSTRCTLIFATHHSHINEEMMYVNYSGKYSLISRRFKRTNKRISFTLLVSIVTEFLLGNFIGFVHFDENNFEFFSRHHSIIIILLLFLFCHTVENSQ